MVVYIISALGVGCGLTGGRSVAVLDCRVCDVVCVTVFVVQLTVPRRFARERFSSLGRSSQIEDCLVFRERRSSGVVGSPGENILALIAQEIVGFCFRVVVIGI